MNRLQDNEASTRTQICHVSSADDRVILQVSVGSDASARPALSPLPRLVSTHLNSPTAIDCHYDCQSQTRHLDRAVHSMILVPENSLDSYSFARLTCAHASTDLNTLRRAEGPRSYTSVSPRLDRL